MFEFLCDLYVLFSYIYGVKGYIMHNKYLVNSIYWYEYNSNVQNFILLYLLCICIHICTIIFINILAMSKLYD